MPEAKIAINGVEYPIPTADTFDLDEAEILWNYAQTTIPDLLFESGRLFQPGVLRAVLHVALRRHDPAATAEEIRAAIGTVNVFALIESFARLAEDDADPPAEPTPNEPQKSEPPRSDGSSRTSSGVSSTNGTSAPESDLPRIGIQRSGTSATSEFETLGV